MSESNGGLGSRQMVAVFRAPSAVMIDEGEVLRVRSPLQAGSLLLTFRTRYLDKGLDHPLPGDMWIEGRGPADTIEEAVSVFGGAAASVVAVIALATNAAVHELEPELVFDSTPGVSEREFLQSFLPSERAIPGVGRILDKGSLVALMEAIERSDEQERIGRAMAQYRLALNHWRWGREVMATAHLYMGMEALTKAVMRSRQRAEGISETEFARRLGIDSEKLRKGEVDVAVRRKILFRGDEDCYQGARKASDGLEHGFMPFGKIREHAVMVRDRTATYLREAIIALADLDETGREKLLTPPQTEPLGRWSVVKYARGQLVGSGEKLARDGNEYPILVWESSIKSVTVEETGQRSMTFEEHLSPQLGDGIGFQLESFEVWRP